MTGKKGAFSVISHGRTAVWVLGLVVTCLLFLLSKASSAGELIQASVSEKIAPWAVTKAVPSAVVAQLHEEALKGNRKLGSSVNQLLEAHHRGGLVAARAFSKSRNMVLHDDRVQVVITTREEALPDVRQAVKALGGQDQLHYRNLLQAMVPISALESLAERPDIQIIREPQRAVIPQESTPAAIALAGSQTTEGVTATNASAWHGKGYTGTGVRVAVLDRGFAGYAGLLGTDLPSSVTTYDWAGTGMETGGPHGTACAEIIYDMAPGVKMDLHHFVTEVEYGNAVDQAIADGADIISQSVGFTLGGPGDGTGFWADIVAKARSHGIFFAQAAGNSAQESWSGTFTASSVPQYHEWTPGAYVNPVGPGDGSVSTIRAGIRIGVSLHWDDWTAVTNNYDLILLYFDESQAQWVEVAASRDLQNGGEDQGPIEYISINAPYTGAYGIVVAKYSATRNVCFRVLVDSPLTFYYQVASRSLIFPADSPDAITVGAVDADSPYPLEPYSSQGPTFGPGGSCSGGSMKPNVASYDNVSTVTYGVGGFHGSSGATPHVAGAAALVKQAYPGFTVTQLQSFLETRALDLGDVGKDNLYGAGRLYLGQPPPPPKPKAMPWIPLLLGD